ncbi:MAG: lipopolysaccharide assembly protein LapB [Gammaproteobacteria bacterium]
MAVEYLFAVVVALLPVAALSGWYLGRRELSRRMSGMRRGGMSPDYFRGLNYLLEDRPDKAIEVFIKVLEVESETIDTHLALGNLFRRRGEVDRAIRIHQNIVAKPTLEFEQRTTALLELGLDYMRSGLLDRAESLFKELLETGAHQRQAIDHLVDIYQQERDWDKALEYTGRYERLANRSLAERRAHFLCEKAQSMLECGDVEEASDKLREALKTDSKCVRSSLMQASIAMTAGAYEAAIKHLQRVETQDRAFLPEAIGPLVESYQALDDTQALLDYLAHLCDLHAGITPVLVMTELMHQQGRTEEAKRRLIEELKLRPTVRGIDRLIEYAALGDGDSIEHNLNLLKELTVGLLEKKPNYECGKCGFTGRTLHWQCPGCKAWNAVKPVHGIEGE